MDHLAPCMTEQSDPYCLSLADAEALLAAAPWRRFGVIGDSLSAGVGDPSPGYGNLGWAARVAGILSRVRPDLAYLNIAEIRATTSQTLQTQVARMLEFGPDLLHLPCAANDLLRRTPDYDEIAVTLRRLYEIATDTGATLTTFTLGRAYVVPVFPDWPDRVRRVNDLTRTLAAEHGAVVIDMYPHPVNDRPDLLSADQIHFSTSGQAVMATEVVKALAGRLAGLPSEVGPGQGADRH